MVGSATGAVTPVAMNTNGMVLIGSNGADPVAAVITAGAGIAVTNGAGSISIAISATNPVIQRVYTSTSALIVIDTAMPIDDTIPQITEGEEVLTLAITPTNASNILEIEFTVNCMGQNANANALAALFQDATAGALAASRLIAVTNEAGGASAILKHTMVAGTVAATTFRIRMGYSANTVNVNGNSGAREFGGVSSTTLTIVEYKV